MLVDQFIENMKGKEITKQEGSFSPLIFLSFLPGCFSPYSDKYYDFDFGSFVYLNKGNYGVIFFDLQKYFDTSRATFKKLDIVKKVEELPEVKDMQETSEEVDKKYSFYQPEKLTSLSSADLGELANDVFDMSSRMLISTVFSEGTGDELIKEFYDTLGGKEQQWPEFWEHAILATFETLLLKEDQLLLQLDDSFSETDLYGLQWVYTIYNITPELSEIKKIVAEKLKNKTQSIKIQKEKMELEIKENQDRLRNYKKLLEPSLQSLIDYAQTVMFVRDTRKEPINKIFTLISNISREVLKRKSIPVENAQYVVGPIDFPQKLYERSDYQDILEKRKKGLQVYMDEYGMKLECGPIDNAKLIVYKSMDGDTSETSVIKGSIACKGSAKGIVKVILSKEDFDRFESGNILVTSMTRPEFVPLMKQSAAVVTDEGGLTCHAAIVSRELNLPCIIGTKNATRMLKDGDEVEVDADQGIVKIIKHDG